MCIRDRYYERIGDHAVNIGGRVRYMVTGWLPEHTGAARVQARTRTEHPSDEADDDAGEPVVAANGDGAGVEGDGRSGLRLAPPAQDA